MGESIILIPAPVTVMAQTRKEIMDSGRKYIPVSLMEPAAAILREWAANLETSVEQDEDFEVATRGTVEQNEKRLFQAAYLCGIAQGAIERGEPLDENLTPVQDAMRRFARDVMDSGRVPYARLGQYVAENFCSVLTYAWSGGDKFVEF